MIDTSSEVEPENYSNIDAWHTYAARAVLDEQPLLIQLTTFEQNGVEMVSLYHDHNVLTEEAYQWGVKNSGSTQAGPTDSVTNQAVTHEALAKSKLFQLLNGVNSSPFSLAPSAFVDSLTINIASRIKNPKARLSMFSRLLGKLNDLKRDRDELGVAFGKGYTRKAIEDPRKEASINRESAFREAVRRAELEDQAHAKHSGILYNKNLVKLKAKPVHGW